MNFFTQSGTIELPAGGERIPDMVAAVQRLVDYTGGSVTFSDDHSVEFEIPPFIFAGRTRPLARLSSGRVMFSSQSSGFSLYTAYFEWPVPRFR